VQGAGCRVRCCVQGAGCRVLVQSAECRVLSAGCWVRHALCQLPCVGAKRFTELRAWQLARQLKVEVDEAILAKPEAQADRRFYDQLSDAVRSAPRNLAEGFGRYHHREFAHFTRIARSSLRKRRITSSTPTIEGSSTNRCSNVFGS
jgi:23S rRNA-intervening sequence protein